MALLYVKQKGDFKRATTFVNNILKKNYISILREYGEKGVIGLKDSTPKDTGKTSESWYYEIKENKAKHYISLVFLNSNVSDGVPIAILIQYGHGTRNGAYVQGRDYINPVCQPLFDELANKLWKEVIGK